MKRWEVACNGCQKNIHISFYMLQDQLWKSIAKPSDKHLCLECVQERLGRKLDKSDFQSLPINYIFGHLPYEESPMEFRKSIIGHWMAQTDGLLKILRRQRRSASKDLNSVTNFKKWLEEEWQKLL